MHTTVTRLVYAGQNDTLIAGRKTCQGACADLSFVLVQAAHFGKLGLGQLVLRIILKCLTKVALGHALIIHVEVGPAS